MEFTVACPIDGAVEVSLEDIDNVVLRESDRADITFVCPHCGAEIRVTAVVPAFLMAAIEALADDPDTAAANGIVVVSSASESADHGELHPAMMFDANDLRANAYCEYFKRQLERVHSVDDILNEIDSAR